MVAALGTSAGEQQLITGDGSAGCRVLQYGGRKYHMVQIRYLSAGGTDKVRVRLCGVVVTFQPVDHADRLDNAFFLEHANVPVDRSKAQIGEIRLQLLVDPFGSRVGFGVTNTFQDRVTLFAVFSRSFHVHLLFNNNSYYDCYSSTAFAVCKEENKNYF